MLPEPAKIGPVKYESPEFLPQYAEFAGAKRSGVTLANVGSDRPRWSCAQNLTVGFSFSAATAATIYVCELSLSQGTLYTSGSAVGELMLADLGEPQLLASGAEPSQAETRGAASPVLEMRLPKRSLRDKSGEELSDFERDYPW